jgi:radical SAM protein with 4Fe4S-binding SPASM domain
MKAINLTGKAPGGTRQKLIDILPLSTPLIIQIFPVYACSLKCNYCIFQIPKEKRHFISDEIVMPVQNYQKYISDMKMFEDKIKVLRFVGIGEPLLHPEISDMIKFAKHADIAEKTEIITNGLPLFPFTSKKLIESGLDRLVISVQGISAKRYNENCDTKWRDIDFKIFVNNIKYFYENKKDTHVYIKIVDSALKAPNEEKKFYRIFEDICDSIAVETTVPIHNEISLPEKNKTQFGQDLIDSCICPQPFYHIQINPDGLVVPCQSFEYPEILGSANVESVVDIWNNYRIKEFRRDHISGINNKVCKNCKMKKYRMHKEDILPIERMEELY